MAQLVALDLATARTNEKHGISGNGIIVIDAPDVFTIRVDKLSNDALPGLERLHVEAPCGETLSAIWVTNAALAGTARILVVD